MESASLRRVPPLPSLIQVGLIAGLVILAALAWAVTSDRMEGMDAGPGTDLGALGWFIGVWVVMMAAMMFPAIWPMVAMYARVHNNKRERGAEVPAGALALFVAGYLVAWSLAGLIGYGLFEGFRSADIGFLAWDEGGRYLAAGVLFGAAVYQLTPLKNICLTKCRNPLMFLLHSWHPGRVGALRMGISHGTWCVGCCWALMAALFALGVMSIGWMALIAAFIALEKLLPWRALATGAVTAVLVILAVAVLASPGDVPGLTVPGSPEADQAMEAMGMEGDAGMEMESGPATGAGEEPAMGAESESGMGMKEDDEMGGMQP